VWRSYQFPQFAKTFQIISDSLSYSNLIEKLRVHINVKHGARGGAAG
jgi:hypothetical protein